MMRRPAGVALITVMLVVAIATLAATALLSASSIAIHRTAALRDTEQAGWIARGVEAWVMGLLRQYHEKNAEYDALDETPPVDHLPVDEGYVRGGLFDAQGRFNLNNLDRRGNPQAVADYQKQFETLVASLPDTQVPQTLVASIQDWIDEDPVPLAGGAEDSFYMGLNPPYRAANRRLTVVSELLAIQGMTPEIYAALRDFVAVLPDPGTRVNVNTAPVPVLVALGIDPAKASQWDARRKDQPVTNAGEFDLFIHDYLGPGGKRDYLSYATEYFVLQGDVFVGSGHVSLYSLIHRQGTAAPTVLAHSADAE